MGFLKSLFGSKETAQKPKVRRRPNEQRAGLGNQFSLDEMTVKKVCELLAIHDLRGPMLGVIKCRKLMCEWASRVGERGLMEKRKFMLHQFRQVEGITVIEEPDE